ncbi:hypothetical protein [Halomonas sp. QHL1]|uniref:hypothetical protein n=1 Tax=Halomonas sp. QHL1 TaxID=1123773 RepID=UPI0008FD1D8E|nr:hypothetical protein [Halomonas sp. QHL1]OJA07131.1 hypothetical protein QHL1GM_17875 [Halomonas sp. QHL1]
MVEALLTLASQLFNRKRNLLELTEALNRYFNNSECIGAQLGLEAAFYDAFKKRASAKLIGRIAALEWGPRESLRIFGQTSHNIKCNFNTNDIDILKLNRYPGKWLTAWKFFSGVLLQAFGLTLLFLGTYILCRMAVDTYFSGTIKIQELSLLSFAEIFQSAGVGILFTVFGVLFVHVGWKGISSMESDTQAHQLKRMLCHLKDKA